MVFHFDHPSPHPEIPVYLHTFLKKILALETPIPSELSMTICGVGMDNFWNYTFLSQEDPF